MMINNYWDWVFPYSFHNISNIFRNIAFSWNDFGVLGTPLSYVSGYYSSLLLSLGGIAHLQSEWAVWGLIIFLFGLSLWFAYKIRAKKDLVVLLAAFNPAIFYKLLAGHVSYWISYTLCLGILYFLAHRFEKKLTSYIALGLLVAFAGAQIQFFVFIAIILLIYFVLNREKFQLRFFIVSAFIAFLINLPWLSNFLVGAREVGAASQGAADAAFSGSMFASPVRIFFMVFSEATDIQYVYAKPWLVFFGLFTLLTVCSVFYYLFARKKAGLAKDRPTEDKTAMFFSASWITFSVLCTGYFQKVPIPFIKTLYPMLREVGHFAPVVILFEVLAFSATWPFLYSRIVALLAKRRENGVSQVRKREHYEKIISSLLMAYLFAFVAVNGYCFYRYLPRVDFAKARAQFQPFDDFGRTDASTYRVLTYPFWNQYGFLSTPDLVKNDKLLNNSGWDSFIEFSGKDHISNYQAGGKSINDTLQYRLLTTLSLDELRAKNVKYVYDLSQIYQSNWDKYTSPETYNNDIALIKNDPNFFQKLVAANPGELEMVSAGIYEIKSVKPRIFATDQGDISGAVSSNSLLFAKINPTNYKIYIKNLKGTVDLNFLDSYHKDWHLYLGNANEASWCEDQTEEGAGATECLGKQKFGTWNAIEQTFEKPIFDETHQEKFGYANGWTIDSSKLKAENLSQIHENPDGTIDVELTLSFGPQGPFDIALALSVITILSASGYLLYVKFRRKN